MSRQDMKPRITCSHCQNQLSITWISQMVRCSFCQAIITINRNDSLGEHRRISYHVSENLVPVTANPSGAEHRSCHPKLEKVYERIKKLASGSSNPRLVNTPSRTQYTVPTIRPKQRAVLCGVTYSKKRKYKLKGTLADVRNMKDLLMSRFQFPEEGIRVLTDEMNNPLIPTKKNIQDSLQWLVQDCRSGDSLVFFFSGHGVRQPEFNDDEHDGFDESICPVDFMEEGVIHDNDINDMIVRPLKPGVTLHAIVDACHSGTILDLPFVYNHAISTWVNNSPKAGAKGTSGGLAISFSACADSEIAADTSAFEGDANGAMTYIFAKVIRENPDITYHELLAKVHQEIMKANEVYCLKSRRLARIFHRPISQEPLLASSMKFNVNKTKFSFWPQIDTSEL